MGNCPHCGGAVGLVKAGKGSPKSNYTVNGKQFNNVAEMITEQQPIEQTAEMLTMHSHVLVPAAQSFLTGLAFGVPSAAIFGTLGYEPNECVTIGSIIAISGMGITWLFKQGLYTEILWIIESITGWELTGDHTIGKVLVVDTPDTANSEPIKLHIDKVREDGSAQYLNLTLPTGVTDEMFRNWAGQVVRGIKPIGRDNWAGRGMPFGRPTYDKFLAELSEAGIIIDNKDGKGRVLTIEGRRSLARMLARTTPQ